jgi:cytochrome c biogenesis protein
MSRSEPVPVTLVTLLRNSWRQLTSMRTALVLLFLLAMAAIPGSVLPQRGVSPEKVDAWFVRHPSLAPVVDRIGGFDVYASPWFSAIYLLLFVSLLACVLPRLRDHLRALRSAPVDAPRRLSRLPHHAGDLRSGGEPGQVGRALRAALRSRRWRAVMREHGDGSVTVSAEKGYLKETGNLLMHGAMVAVLVGVALGGWYGWHGNKPLVTGPDQESCHTLQQYEEYRLGQRVDQGDLPDFCLTLTGFQAEYTEDGQPVRYLAGARVSEDGGEARPVEFAVNSPLRLDGATVYLLNEGYAPVLRYTDRYGATQSTTVVFVPNGPHGTGEGVARFPDANVSPDGERDPDAQVAFQGLYLPTAPAGPEVLGRLLQAGVAPTSVHPGERSPALALQAYRGDLGLDRGVPQSMRSLDQEQVDARVLEPVGEPRFLRPGEAMTLDDGTEVAFVGTQRWITVSVRHDPGGPVVLAGAALVLAGLVASLTGRRRRFWLRITPAPDGSLVEAGGLPRSDYPGFADEFAQLVSALPLVIGTAVPEPADGRL